MTQTQATKYIGKIVRHWTKLPGTKKSILVTDLVTGLDFQFEQICLVYNGGIIFEHNIFKEQ